MTAIELLSGPRSHAGLATPIRTTRLQLQPFEPGDVPSIAALYADPEVTRWMGGVKGQAEAAASVLRMRDSFKARGWGTLAVHLLDGGTECLGYCGVRPLSHTQDVEIAFGIQRAHWGKGIATEASSACINAAFTTLSLPSIVATVYPENTRSLAVIEKLKMKKEADVFGQWPNSIAWLFRVTRNEWERSAD